MQAIQIHGSVPRLGCACEHAACAADRLTRRAAHLVSESDTALHRQAA